ncbi:hypothetical protein NLG97_g7149 [Lecanicillium saksenae]|uniref:Uncharacterized protein n=1 Tax=Lecanicillium saksenae TaxID=468837 RepID=A0ACC1QPG5_9HYPO|nr:hypothetical protein NLG97_g7149 [Lecanicillium saksenae]
MKASTLFCVVAGITVSAYTDEEVDLIAPDLDAIPSCGFYCFQTTAKDTGCKDENDVACICNNLDTFVNNVYPCECTYCSLSDVARSNTEFALQHLCRDLQDRPDLVPLAASLIAGNVSTAAAETTRTEDICAKETEVPSASFSIPVSGAPVKTTSASPSGTTATATNTGSSSTHAAGSSHGLPSATPSGTTPSSATPSNHGTPVSNGAMKAAPVLGLAAIVAGLVF